ncbi:MAG: alkaline phosphatase family protein, partial [Caldilineaceae bacterium]|nr:alkaline phosphatase family protein [Caldilineaceae bacterium]
VALLTQRGKDSYSGHLQGPARQQRGGQENATIEFQLTVNHDACQLQIAQQQLRLNEGRWSPILELTFRLGLFVKIRVLTRVILTQTEPTIKLYFLPLQLHPLHSPWRYGTPKAFLKELWRDCGPFLTLGWPQDTTGLEDGCITDSQFLALCDEIFAGRERILLHQLQRFDEGLLAAVFDSLDRIQHMFWRDRPDIVDQWYQKLDALVGKVAARLDDSGRVPTKVLVVSDHGFAKFDHKVHLNRWLVEHGYLTTRPESATASHTDQSLRSAAWRQSQAYALGLNSVYLNLAGREGQGAVQPNEADTVTERLCTELTQWRGPDGRAVVQQVWRRAAIFDGPYAAYGPDLVIGYAPGYRGSAQTGLGQWQAQSIEPNRDHWGADHCIDPQAV